jgi:hypothetical protein
MGNVSTSTGPFLTTAELAERWRTTTLGVYRLRERGDGPRGHKIGRRVLYRIEDVEAWEATRADHPRAA